MVLFAMLLFGLFAMATLVIDLGVVRVTQRQMQTAADSAALEGLRFRDPPVRSTGGTDDPETPGGGGGTTPTDPPDDGGGSGGFPGNANPPPFGGGTGPGNANPPFWSGTGPGNANPPPFGDGGFPGNANPPPFQGPGSGDDEEDPGDGGGDPPPEITPGEQEERRRQAASDMVAWMYGESTFAAGATPTNFGASRMLEFSGGVGDPNFYASQLMTINETAYLPIGDDALRLNLENAPDGDLYAPEPDRFEVKLRRTGESVDENQRSAGPRIPFMFGRGTMLNDDNGSRQPINYGIAVEATGKAKAVPAVAVGRSVIEPYKPGGLNVAISVANWMNPGDVLTGSYRTKEPVRYVGQAVAKDNEADETTKIKSGYGYVGIVEDIDGADRVVGFVLVRVQELGDDYSISKLSEDLIDRPMGDNTSASWGAASYWLNSMDHEPLTPETIGKVLKRNRRLPGEVPDIVHAPVSAGMGP